MIGTLARFAYLSSCTLGRMTFGDLTLATVERPWIANPNGPGGMRRVSCIPDARYLVKSWNSARFPNTFILLNNAVGVYEQPNLIPPGQKYGRDAILIHSGVSVEHVVGCIAVGLEHHGEIVTHTFKAMNSLRLALSKEKYHTLHIQPVGTKELHWA